MDNKKHESYEETHKKLVEAMQNACIQDEFDDYDTPKLDFSFLNEEPAASETKKKHKFFTTRFSKVAAILIVFLLTGNIIMMATNSSESYGEKGLIHRLSETITGVVTDNDTPVDEDEIIAEYLIESEKDFYEIMKIIPKIYVPEYIPDMYELNEFKVICYKSGDYFVKSNYINGTSIFYIEAIYGTDYNARAFVNNVSGIEEIIQSDRKIYLYLDKNENSYIADIYFDDCYIIISGISDKHVIETIARNLTMK